MPLQVFTYSEDHFVLYIKKDSAEMKAFNCYFVDEKTLNTFITENRIKEYDSVLIQVFSGNNNPQFIKALIKTLKSVLPQASIMGTSSSGEILNGEYSQRKVVLSFMCFENIKVKTEIVIDDKADLYQSGKYLADSLIKEDTKALLVFSQGNLSEKFEPFKFVQGINDVNQDVMLAGGAASSISTGMGTYSTNNLVRTYVFTEAGISSNTAAACTFNGKYLQTFNDYNLGWKTIGKKMVITKSVIQGSFSRVYEIDNIRAKEIYRKYFGDQVADNLPYSALNFSFIIKRNGMEIDATPVNIYDDDSILYPGMINEGEIVQFGLGDADIILNEAYQGAKRLAKHYPEAVYIYTCATRPLQLSYITKNELIPYKNIAPLSGFFTNTEYYHYDNSHYSLGKTMTIFGLSEVKPEDRASLPEIEINSGIMDDGKLTTMLAMTNMLQRMTSELEIEHKRSEDLLLNILPAPIAEILKEGHQTIADKIDDVTILFSDLVGFTKLASKEDPEKLVKILNQMVSIFDILAEKYNLEKIKTIGDAYFVAGGVPLPLEKHTELIMKFAIEMLNVIKDFRTQYYPELDLRIGIHCGAVMAGVIGTKKFTYDLWGDTVNTASRMESHGIPGRIHVSEQVYDRLKDHYTFDPPRIIEIKGKGKMNTYLLSSI